MRKKVKKLMDSVRPLREAKGMHNFTPDMFGLTGHGMRLRTIRGYDFGEVSSAMQKAIRRGETPYAGYWALELWASGFGHYVWKRLLTVSAEDCWGIITQEVKALHDSYAMINANLSGRRARGRIFISKAVILLCAAKKSRDADHLQNFVYDEMRGIDPDTLADELRSAPEYVPIPEYALDCHTRRGKAAGRTKADFFKAEQEALRPFQPGLFDEVVDWCKPRKVAGKSARAQSVVQLLKVR